MIAFIAEDLLKIFPRHCWSDRFFSSGKERSGWCPLLLAIEATLKRGIRAVYVAVDNLPD
jgi:hypothetical protein